LETLKAGAASIDISPRDSQFLFGYPSVERYSTGVHDPLLSSALYLSGGKTQVMFISNDIIYVSKGMTQRARKRVAEATGVSPNNIMITATHTHSGPVIVDHISNENDPVVPKADREYLGFLEDGIVAAAIEAYDKAQPAQVGLAIADGTGVGTNRRDPSEPADPQVPVLMVKAVAPKVANIIACMVTYSMHPTVLHEDSKFISGDFPGMTRRFLQRHMLGEHCPVLYHTGPAGNQSPRHVTRANTFAEAERLGEMLGRAITKVIPAIRYTSSISLACTRGFVDLPKRTLPSVSEAEAKLKRVVERLEHLWRTNAPRPEARTAEVDWFGAQETLTLAQAAEEGRLDPFYESCLPAEVQIIRIGPWSFVGWPGEIFVEYALAVKEKYQDVFIISLANGELQGYVVTEDAALKGGYEASNALFGSESGNMLVDMTLRLLSTHGG
jgi:neutral ceramidase